MFLASRIRIRSYFCWSRSGSFYLHANRWPKTVKEMRKIRFFSSVLWLLNNLLSLFKCANRRKKYDQNKLWKKLIFCWQLLEKSVGYGSIIQWYGSADPDPYQNLTDQDPWKKTPSLSPQSSSCHKIEDKRAESVRLTEKKIINYSTIILLKAKIIWIV